MSSRRMVVRLLHRACRLMWGFDPAIVELIVADRGALGAVAWFGANMPRYLLTMRVLGPVRVHLACVVVSLRNGCRYCAHGHVYALELIHVRDTGRLFPIDARRLEEWFGLDDRTLLRRLHAALAEAGLHVEALWVDRVLALADGSQSPLDGAEASLSRIVRMVTTMNEVSIAGLLAPDEAHDPVNKDMAVRRAHAELRAAAGT